MGHATTEIVLFSEVSLDQSDSRRPAPPITSTFPPNSAPTSPLSVSCACAAHSLPSQPLPSSHRVAVCCCRYVNEEGTATKVMVTTKLNPFTQDGQRWYKVSPFSDRKWCGLVVEFDCAPPWLVPPWLAPPRLQAMRRAMQKVDPTHPELGALYLSGIGVEQMDGAAKTFGSFPLMITVRR